MRITKTLFLLPMLVGALALAVGCPPPKSVAECGDGTVDTGEECDDGNTDSGDGCSSTCQLEPCNNDGVCDPGETVRECPLDACGSVCVLPNMTGDEENFLVKTLFIPDSATGALENGVDLNGDGIIDNKLGSIIALLAAQGMDDDINVMINQEIADGGLLLVARLTDSGNSDNITAVQILLARVSGGATPVFGGSDTVELDPSFDDSIYLCGDWDSPGLVAGPADLPFAIPLPDIGTVNVTLESAMVLTDTDLFADSAATTSGLTNVVIGGGLSKEQINDELIPFVHTFLVDMIEGGGDSVDVILGLFDNNCDLTVCPGSDTDPDCADDGVITVKELQCNMLLNTALAPDVDIDGDGEEDLLSLGLTLVEAVPVTVADATP